MARAKNSFINKKRNNLSLPEIFYPAILIFLGIAIVFWASFKSAFLPSKSISHKTSDLSYSNTVRSQAKPAKLYVPRLSRILYIADGEVVDNRWTISQTGVSYLTGSAIPGSIGNSVLYGHNRKDILGGLPKVSNSDLIYVVMENGEFAKYEVFETKEIKPTQVEILVSTSDTRLTIYTCSGFLDQARFVVVARLVSTSQTSLVN